MPSGVNSADERYNYDGWHFWFLRHSVQPTALPAVGLLPVRALVAPTVSIIPPVNSHRQILSHRIAAAIPSDRIARARYASKPTAEAVVRISGPSGPSCSTARSGGEHGRDQAPAQPWPNGQVGRDQQARPPKCRTSRALSASCPAVTMARVACDELNRAEPYRPAIAVRVANRGGRSLQTIEFLG